MYTIFGSNNFKCTLPFDEAIEFVRKRLKESGSYAILRVSSCENGTWLMYNQEGHIAERRTITEKGI